MKRLIIIIVLAVAAVASSLMFSEGIYRFYMKNYYNISGKDKKKMVAQAYKMFEAKKYKKLEKFIFPLMIVYNDVEIKRLAGMNYIKLGDRKRGADLITQTLESSPGEIKYVRIALEILYEERFYGDIVGIVEDNKLYSDLKILHYYARSLYKLKRYKKAIKVLHRVKIRGNFKDVNFYLGRSYEELKDYSKAAIYLYGALKENPDDMMARNSLIRVYSRLGKYKEATRFMKVK